MTPLKQPDCAMIKITNIPEEIMKEYKLNEKVTTEWWVYVKVHKGIYGLP